MHGNQKFSTQAATLLTSIVIIYNYTTLPALTFHSQSKHTRHNTFCTFHRQFTASPAHATSCCVTSSMRASYSASSIYRIIWLRGDDWCATLYMLTVDCFVRVVCTHGARFVWVTHSISYCCCLQISMTCRRVQVFSISYNFPRSCVL